MTPNVPDSNLPAPVEEPLAEVVPLPFPVYSFDVLVADWLTQYTNTASGGTTTMTHPHRMVPSRDDLAAAARVQRTVRGWGLAAIFFAVSLIPLAALDHWVWFSLSSFLAFSTLALEHKNAAIRNRLSTPAQKPALKVRKADGTAYSDFNRSLKLVKDCDAAPEVILGLEERAGFMDELLLESARLVDVDVVDSPQSDAVTARMRYLAAEAHALGVLAHRRRQVIAAASLETEMLLARMPGSLRAVGEEMSEEAAFIDEVLNP